jgi:hypothetical protein
MCKIDWVGIDTLVLEEEICTHYGSHGTQTIRLINKRSSSLIQKCSKEHHEKLG